VLSFQKRIDDVCSEFSVHREVRRKRDTGNWDIDQKNRRKYEFICNFNKLIFFVR